MRRGIERPILGSMRGTPWLLPFLLVLPVTARAAGGEAEGLRVVAAPRFAPRAAVVVIAVACPEPPVRVTATAFGREVVFYPDPDGKTWRGLVGIDVETRPGEYLVTIEAARLGQAALTATHRLRVDRTQFPTRRLRVAERYVNPPAEIVERIQRETRRLRAIFEEVAPRRWDGPFLSPVHEDPAGNFGARSVFNGQPRNPHAGVDFRSPEGTPIRAPNAGQVVLADDLFFTGNTVVVDHGLGLYSLFAHLSRIDVEHGQAIEPGETVGLVGATGRATGPHLHWAVRLGGARVDPLSLIAALETSAAAPASQR